MDANAVVDVSLFSFERNIHNSIRNEVWRQAGGLNRPLNVYQFHEYEYKEYEYEYDRWRRGSSGPGSCDM